MGLEIHLSELWAYASRHRKPEELHELLHVPKITDVPMNSTKWNTYKVTHRSEYIDTPQGFMRMGMLLFSAAISAMSVSADLTTEQMVRLREAFEEAT